MYQKLLRKYRRCKELGDVAWKDNDRLTKANQEFFDDRIESEQELKKFQAKFLIKDSQLDFANFKYGEELKLNKRTQKKLNKVTLNRNKCLHKIDQLEREGLGDYFVEEAWPSLETLNNGHAAKTMETEVLKATSQRVHTMNQKLLMSYQSHAETIQETIEEAQKNKSQKFLTESLNDTRASNHTDVHKRAGSSLLNESNEQPN